MQFARRRRREGQSVSWFSSLLSWLRATAFPTVEAGTLLVLVIALLGSDVKVEAGSGCSMQNYCNGHGLCRNTYSQCDCYAGWGAASDIATYKAPDCSQRK